MSHKFLIDPVFPHPVGGGEAWPPTLVSDLADVEVPEDGQVVLWADASDPMTIRGGVMRAYIETAALLSPYAPPAGYVQWMPTGDLDGGERQMRVADDTQLMSLSFAIPDAGLGHSWALDYGFYGHEASLVATWSGTGGFFDGSGPSATSAPCQTNSVSDSSSVAQSDVLNAQSGGTLTFSAPIMDGAMLLPWVRIRNKGVYTYHAALA